jgi:hypothetical protein
MFDVKSSAGVSNVLKVTPYQPNWELSVSATLGWDASTAMVLTQQARDLFILKLNGGEAI